MTDGNNAKEKILASEDRRVGGDGNILYRVVKRGLFNKVTLLMRRTF